MHNFGITSDDDNFDIPDHPANDKWGIYFKLSLPKQTLSISILDKCINLEITIDG